MHHRCRVGVLRNQKFDCCELRTGASRDAVIRKEDDFRCGMERDGSHEVAVDHRTTGAWFDVPPVWGDGGAVELQAVAATVQTNAKTEGRPALRRRVRLNETVMASVSVAFDE